jgi:hypothetical protein
MASGLITDGVFSQFTDLNIVCRISEGRKDRHPRLIEGRSMTRPMATDQTAAAIVNPVECEGAYALVGRGARASFVVFGLAPDGTLPDVKSARRVRYICVPKGAPVGPRGIGLDTEPACVVQLLCDAFRCGPSQIVVTILKRPWTNA